VDVLVKRPPEINLGTQMEEGVGKRKTSNTRMEKNE